MGLHVPQRIEFMQQDDRPATTLPSKCCFDAGQETHEGMILSETEFLPPTEVLPITHESHVALARLAGGQLADSAGLHLTERYCITISISELASNILRHAGAGMITIKVIAQPDGKRGLEVLADDQGKGIEDVNLARQDGYSTDGGIGGGLPGVCRLMSEVEISSTLNKGTSVRAVKWSSQNPSSEKHLTKKGQL